MKRLLAIILVVTLMGALYGCKQFEKALEKVKQTSGKSSETSDTSKTQFKKVVIRTGDGRENPDLVLKPGESITLYAFAYTYDGERVAIDGGWGCNRGGVDPEVGHETVYSLTPDVAGEEDVIWYGGGDLVNVQGPSINVKIVRE